MNEVPPVDSLATNTPDRTPNYQKWQLWWTIISTLVFAGILIQQSFAIAPVRNDQRAFKRMATGAIVKILDYESSDNPTKESRQLLIDIKNQLEKDQK